MPDATKGGGLFALDIADFESTNGGRARGGAFDVAGPVVVGGVVYVVSGYALWGGAPGNVLLAFSVDGK